MDHYGDDMDTSIQKAYPVSRGFPTPMGITKNEGVLNFAFVSTSNAKSCLTFFSPGSKHPFLTLPLNPKINRTGKVWHVGVADLPAEFDYGIVIEGLPPLIDPYAHSLNNDPAWGEGVNDPLLNRYKETEPFDWGADTAPQIPMQDMIIYEMHVRGFTISETSGAGHPGGFLGIIEKIPYFKELGVNAIELLPIYEFNECENSHKNPKTGEKLYNYWGYSTINFFSPLRKFGTIEEFKQMVKELHKNKIEVILDVVYNHTAEGNEEGRTYAYRGLANSTYYILGPKGEYYNYSGCGNTLSCNHPIVRKMILDSLRYWAGEMHVDGFRFDLASIMTRDTTGAVLSNPPVIESIAIDPLLANCKLIAEAWDAAGLYQVGSFPAHERFAEWNGKYRDIVRRFIKGSDNEVGNFSTSICGSQDLYAASGRRPYHSINFITSHDGFTLRDLVTYNQKHNEENGEMNRDGMNDNDSWNCGEEGLTSNPIINHLRERQMRNFIVTLFTSIGTPMLLMGDEYGHTRRGNNNTYCHDNELNWFLWDQLKENEAFFDFVKKVITFRKTHTLLRRTEFLSEGDIDWHGTEPYKPDWSSSSRFIAYALKDYSQEEHLYIAYNATHASVTVQLPDPPAHRQWRLIVDTAKGFFEEPEPLRETYEMMSHSSLIAKIV